MPFHAYIDKGELCFPNMKAAMTWREWMEGHESAKVIITEDKPTRSQSQNAYMWAYFEIVARETGHSADDIHEWAKRKFLPARFIKVNGEEMKIPGSTRDLDKAAFSDYLDKIAAEIGI